MKIASSLPIAAIVLLAAAFLLPVRVVITVVVCFIAFSPLSPLHGAVHRALLPRCVSDTFFPLADPLVSATPLSAGSSHTQGDATCKDKRGIFDLTHVVLSFDMDRSQWGNLGYWSAAQPPSYPDACAALASVVFSAAEIAAHDSVLAIGCGSGDELLLLKAGPKNSDPGREWQRPRVAVGVNIAPAQVREAQRRVSAQDAATRQLNGQGPPCCDDQEECEVRVYEGSADNLTPILDAETAIAAASAPVPSAGLFNAVVCIDTAYHFPSRPRFLSSALNALTPGGRIAFTDLLLPPSALSPDVRAGKGVRGMFYAWGMPAVSKAMSIPQNSVLTEEQMHAAMEAAGFVDVKVERIDQHVFQGFADFIERHVTLWGPTVRPLRWAKFLLTALALRAVTMPTLFTPLKVGRMDLSTRVFLPPMTRTRSNPLTLVPGADVAKYYGDRASPGVLLVTEAIYISPETIGLPHAPGIWTPDQVAGWKQVTAAVHAKGGYIYAQLWHVGRIAHPSFSEHPLVKGSGYTTGRSASDVPLEREPAILLGGKRGKHVAPTPFTLEEIERLKRDYGTAAKNAIEAGFDGVELHAAHGYLIDQFLNSGTNKRTDRYGGSIENRVRLLDEVLASLVSAAGADRVAVRLSPHTNTPASALQGMSDPAPAPLYAAAIAAAAKHQLAYLLLTEPRLSFRSKTLEDDLKLAAIPVTVGTNWAPVYRSEFSKAAAAAGASVGTARGGAVVFGAGGFTPMSGALAVSEGIYDGVGIGRWWIANPDLIERIRLGLPLNKYNRALFYVASQEGYNDYPTFTEACEQLGADPSLFATPSTSIVPHAAPAHGAATGLVFGAKEGSEGVYGSPGACEQRAQELVALAEGKLKYGLATIGSIGASTSLAQAQAQAQARKQEEKLVAKM